MNNKIFTNQRLLIVFMTALLLMGNTLLAQQVLLRSVDDAVAWQEFPERTATEPDILANGNILATRYPVTVNEVTTNMNVHAFVKFDISKYAGRRVTAASFSTRGVSKTDMTTTLQIRRAGNNFTRATTNWNNKPTTGTQEIGNKAYTTASARRTYDIISPRLVDYINEELAKGSTEIAFNIQFKGGDLNGMNWIAGTSDGGGTWAPELMLDLDKQQYTYAPLDDASAFKEDPAKTAAIAHTGNIFVQKVDDNTESVSFVKFELKGMAYKKIVSATYSTRGAAVTGKVNKVQLRKVANANFSRETTNWGNKPEMSGRLATREYTTSVRTNYTNVGNDLVNYINSFLARGIEIIPFGLEHDGGDLAALNWMGGKNDGASAPLLTIVPDLTQFASIPTADAVAYEKTDAQKHATNLFVSNVEGDRMISYMTFDISAYKGRVVKSAGFSIRGSMPSGQSMVIKLTRSGDNFTRNDITWDNKPARSGELATANFSGGIQVFAPNGSEFTKYINEKLLAGATVISFAIEYKSGDPKTNWIGGLGDGEGYRPLLTMEFDYGGNLRGIADAVADQSAPEVVWTGHATNIKVAGSADAHIQSFIKFDISAFAGMEIIGAQFSTRGATAAAENLTTVRLAESGTNFARTTTTWTNKPTVGPELATKEYNNASARRAYTNDGAKLMNYINRHTLYGKTELAFALTYKAGDADKLSWIGGVGDGTWGPELVLQVKRSLEGDTILVMADAYVDQVNPTVNYGTTTEMSIRKSGNSTDLEAYLKFDVSKAAKSVIGMAGLRLFIAQHSSGDAAENFYVDVFAVEDQTWTEAAINWENKPTAGLKLIEQNVKLHTTAELVTWKSEALTHYLNTAIAQGKTHISLVLKGKNNTPGKHLFMAAREGGATNTAKLVLDYTVQPPPQKLPVVADSHVSQIAAERNTNFGTLNDQHIINDDANEASKWIYFRYDISGAYKEGVSASLNFYASLFNENPELKEIQLAVYSVSNNDWVETEINWANKPGAGTTELLTATITEKAGRNFNLSSAAFSDYVNQAIREGKTAISIAVKATNATPGNRGWIAGREWASRASFITLNYEPEVALPKFAPNPGLYISSVEVTITSTTPNAKIYYTLDNTDPTESSPAYTTKFTLIAEDEVKTFNLRARAYADNLKPSGIVSATYTVTPVGPVQFNPTPLVPYQGSVLVTLSVEPAGSTILYSLDKTEPTMAYTEPILLRETTTIYAKAWNKAFTYVTPLYTATYEVVKTQAGPGVGPGGVGYKDLSRENQPALSVWLRAQDIVVADGSDKVLLWADQSGNSNDAHNDETNIGKNIPNTGESWKAAPTLVANGVNSWPVVSFGTQFGGDGQNVKNLVVNDADNLDGGAGNSIFIVLKRNQMYADFAAIIQKRDTRNQPLHASWILEMDGGANPNKMQYVVARDIFLKSQDAFNTNDYYVVNASLNSKHKLTAFMTNGTLKSSAMYAKPIQNSHAPIILGGFQPMDVAEVVLFNSDVNMAQTVIVNNYLAAKYNLQVENVLYTNTTFIHDVIGVGRAADITGAGFETHNNSYGGGLLLSASTFTANGDFVFAGHNGVELNELSRNDRWSRSWYIKKAGNGANITLSFDFDAPGIKSTPTTDYILIFKENESAQEVKLQITPTVSQNMLRFNLSNFQEGIYTLENMGTGTDNITTHDGFLVYPNPATDRVVIQMHDQFSGKVNIRILDIYGRTVRSESVVKDLNVMQHNLELSGLNAGTYMIELMSNNRRSVKMIVVK
jgi:hypothetical protein